MCVRMEQKKQTSSCSRAGGGQNSVLRERTICTQLSLKNIHGLHMLVKTTKNIEWSNIKDDVIRSCS